MVKLPSEKVNDTFMIMTVVFGALSLWHFALIVLLMMFGKLGSDTRLTIPVFVCLIGFGICYVLYELDPFGPKIDQLMIERYGQNIVRRKVRSTIVGCGYDDDGEHCLVTVRAGKSSEFTFDEIELEPEFMQIGAEVALVLDEYRDDQDRPVYRKQVNLEKMKTPS